LAQQHESSNGLIGKDWVHFAASANARFTNCSRLARVAVPNSTIFEKFRDEWQVV